MPAENQMEVQQENEKAPQRPEREFGYEKNLEKADQQPDAGRSIQPGRRIFCTGRG